MKDTLEPTTLHEKVIFHEPDAEWSAECYEQELDAYVTVRGRAPQSVTMHPDTAEVLGLSEETVDPSLTSSLPLVVTSRDYDRHTITLYY